MRNWIVLVALGAAWLRAATPEPAADEYHIKGAYLLNFAKFVEWPESAFKGPGDSIALCVLGTSPFSPALDSAAHAVLVEKRPVVVRQVSDPAQARQCQIVFVSAGERKQAHALLQAVQGANVLTVGETDGFIAEGGVIRLSVEDSRIRMEISTGSARKASLRISAKLLSLAQSGK